ncbi:MAG: hypothetical protein Cons2KO_18740 [Congregibacter sp.]
MSDQSARPGIFAELRRRRVIRTLALYVLGAWVLMQVADVMLPALDLPEKAIRYLLIAAIAGFPVALVFGWFFDITPQGIRRTGPAKAGGDEGSEPLKRSDILLLGALLGVLSLVLYGTLTAVELPTNTETKEGGADRAATRPARTEGPPMVAVLPFTFRGLGEDAAFFAGGVHDDLLTQLSHLSGLRVISRTSVLEYAGTTKNIITIGNELAADAILEGGVQVAGEQLRINAQLIDARTDEHLWAETYDRQLTASNIFAVQSEIAQAIATALKTNITPQEQTALDLIPTENMAAYRAYHAGMKIHYERGAMGKQDEYIAHFEEAIRLDPNFTRAISELIGQLALRNFTLQDPEQIARIELLIDDIARIAPDSVDHLMAQGLYTYYILREYDLASRLIDAARARAPSDTRLIDIESWIAKRRKDLDTWLQSAREGRALEPNNERWTSMLVWRLLVMHKYDEARAIHQTGNIKEPRFLFNGAMLELSQHHDPRAFLQATRDVLARIPDSRRYSDVLFDAALLARDFDAADEAIALHEDQPWPTEDSPYLYIPDKHASELWLAIAMQDDMRAVSLLADFQSALGLSGNSGEPPPERLAYYYVMLLAMASSDEVLRDALRGYDAIMEEDFAVKLMGQSLRCSALAKLKDAAKTVDCLRRGFAQPSDMHPFYEPLLPYYDPVRDTPAFQQLLAELERDGWLKAEP